MSCSMHFISQKLQICNSFCYLKICRYANFFSVSSLHLPKDLGEITYHLIAISNHGLDSSNIILTLPNLANKNILKNWEDIRKAWWYTHSITVPCTCISGHLIDQFFSDILRASCSLFTMKVPKWPRGWLIFVKLPQKLEIKLAKWQ